MGDNLKRAFTEEQKNQILEYFYKGLSSRKICKKLGWDVTRKSTVNDFLKPFRDLIDTDKDTGLRSLEPKERKSLNGVPVNNFGVDKVKKELVEDYEVELQVNRGLSNIKKKKTILVIADTQCKSEESLDYMKAIGGYIADKKPDVIVHIGDHYDFPSLSSYDKGKSSFEGRRLDKDIQAGNLGFDYLNEAIMKDKHYHPRKVFCLGNHENRLDRYVDDNPELIGTLGVDKLPFLEYGWEVVPFLKPVEIDGIFFVHYLANPMNGKPYGGNAMNILKTVGRSFVVGHKQCLDVAIRPTIDGKQQIGIVNGACYDFAEGYKGYQGNNHFRGLTVLHEVEDGFGVPMFVSLDYIKGAYAFS